MHYQWLPMSTAPKMGERVILWDGVKMAVCDFNPISGKWCADFCGWGAFDGDFENPIGWLPVEHPTNLAMAYYDGYGEALANAKWKLNEMIAQAMPGDTMFYLGLTTALGLIDTMIADGPRKES